MELESALELFEEIVELCYESEIPKIIETIESIYSEASESTSISKLLLSLEELQLTINESDILEEEEEILNEVKEKIELLSE